MSHYAVIWIIWLAWFAVWETVALIQHYRAEGAITFTHFTKSFMPKWILWLVCSWLLYHFGISNIGS